MKSEATKFHISLRSKSLVFWLGILSRHGKSQPKRVELRLAQSSCGRRIFRRSQDVDYEYRFCHSSLCSTQISDPRLLKSKGFLALFRNFFFLRACTLSSSGISWFSYRLIMASYRNNLSSSPFSGEIKIIRHGGDFRVARLRRFRFCSFICF